MSKNTDILEYTRHERDEARRYADNLATQLEELKAFIREEIVIEVYNQYGQNNALIATLKSKCAAAGTADEKPDGQAENASVDLTGDPNGLKTNSDVAAG